MSLIQPVNFREMETRSHKTVVRAKSRYETGVIVKVFTVASGIGHFNEMEVE